MNTVRITLLCFMAMFLASCSNLKELAQTPLARDVLGKLRDAIVDIDPHTIVKHKLCEAYWSKGVVLAEAAWAAQWLYFAPLFATKMDPAADLAYCEGLIRDAGAAIVAKRTDSTAATALCFQVQFPRNFGDRSIEERAATTCHEAVHILEQGRVGCGDWAVKYFATISARLTYEGLGHTVQWALLESYGWSADRASSYIRRRADRFPENYSVPREIIPDSCAFDHWSAIRGALRERSGH